MTVAIATANVRGATRINETPESTHNMSLLRRERDRLSLRLVFDHKIDTEFAIFGETITIILHWIIYAL